MKASSNNSGPQRIRSPSYPAISLREAVDRVRLLLDKKGSAASNKEELLKGLGFTGVHGSSQVALAAVKQFGLVVGKDWSSYFITPQGISAVDFAVSEKERVKALRWALRQPRLYRDIFEHFPNHDWEPPEKELRQFLLESGYAETALGRVISAFRTSVDFVKGSTSATDISPTATPDSQSSTGSKAFRFSFTGPDVEIAGEVKTIEQLTNLVEAAKALMGKAE